MNVAIQYLIRLAILVSVGAASASAPQVPFVPNTGQWNSDVAYYVNAGNLHVYIGQAGEFIYRQTDADGETQWILTEKLLGTMTRGDSRLVPIAPSITKVSYFYGADPSKWRQKLPSYEAIHWREAYPGIDLAIELREGLVEKVFTVKAGADPSQIRFSMSGQYELKVNESGNLIASTGLGQVGFSTPTAWQISEEKRIPVDIRWKLDADGSYTFLVGSFNPGLELKIDPLVQATYFGGSAEDDGYSVLHDNGSLYLIGTTESTDLPGTTGGFQPDHHLAHNGYVASKSGGVVSVFSTSTNTVKNSIGVGSLPDALRMTPDGTLVYVSRSQGSMRVINTSTNTVVDTVPDNVRAVSTGAMVFTPDNAFMYTADGSVVSVTDTSTNSVVDTIPIDSAAWGLTITPDGATVYVADSKEAGSVSVISTATNTVVGTIAVGDGPIELVTTPDGAFVYVANLGLLPEPGTISVISTATNTVVDTITEGVGSGPHNMVITPDGEYIYVGNNTSFDMSVISTATNTVVDTINFPFMNPTDLAITPDGALIYATDRNNRVLVIDTTTNLVVDTISVAHGSWGIAVTPLPGANLDMFIARMSGDLKQLLQVTYYGGTGDEFSGASFAKVASNGDLLIFGTTTSADLPGTAGGAQPAYAGATSHVDEVLFGGDTFIVRLPEDLTSLIGATYLGGSEEDIPAGAFLADNGDIYVAGNTSSTDFPGTVGGAQAAYAGPETGGDSDGWLARLSGDLTSLRQATYFGGASIDFITSMVGTNNGLYIGGFTLSDNLPGVAGGAQEAFGGVADDFLALLSTDLKTIKQATYSGGSGWEFGIPLLYMRGDTVYFSGGTGSGDLPGTLGGAQPIPGPGGAFDFDAYMSSYNVELTVLNQATYLGGTGFETGVLVLGEGADTTVYAIGSTDSADFPGVANGAQCKYGGGYDIYVAQLNAELTTLSQATYYGGSGDEYPDLQKGPNGDLYLVGITTSRNLPWVAGGMQDTHGGSDDAFVAILSPDLRQGKQATYYGGNQSDFVTSVAIHANGAQLYITGSTNSLNLSGTTGGAQAVNAGSKDMFAVLLDATLTSDGQASTTTYGCLETSDVVFRSGFEN